MFVSFLVLCIAATYAATIPQRDIDILSPEDKCIATIQKLIKHRNVSRNLGGIVGIGWDSVTNKPTLPIFATTYHLCRTVPDGDFLVPDNVVVFPIKEANLQKTSTIHDSFSSFKNSDGGKLETSVGGGVPGIAEVKGSFSVETKIGKEHMEKNSKTCFENKVEYHAFDLIANENAGFDQSFTDRLKEVAIAIKDGNPLLAQYEAESIIADYGTHVTNRAMAGASIKMLTFATMSEGTDKSTFALKTSAEFKTSVVGVADMGAKAEYDHKTENGGGTKDITSESYIFTKGGPDVNRLFANDAANKMSIDSVVGLTRGGIDLYSVIHRGALKDHEFDDKTLLIVQDMLYNATREYYRRNIIPGCTDSAANNYFFKATVDNNHLCVKDSNVLDSDMQTGGIFQECEYVDSYSKVHSKLKNGSQCEQYRRPNPITGEFKCQHLPLLVQKRIFGTFHVTFKHRVYSAFVNGCNSTDCAKNYTITDKIKVTAYYCKVMDEPDSSFVMDEEPNYQNWVLGGIFEHENIFSDNKRCSDGFNEYPFYNNLKVCLGLNLRIGLGAVIFNGLISCHDVNQDCGPRLQRIFVTTIDNCPYYQCARMGFNYFLKSPSSVMKPPYIDRDLAMSKIRFSYRHELEELEEEKVLSEDGEEVGVIVN